MSYLASLSLDGLLRELSRTERLGEGELPLIIVTPHLNPLPRWGEENFKVRR
jgi:hypothetical protein